MDRNYFDILCFCDISERERARREKMHSGEDLAQDPQHKWEVGQQQSLEH